jgi:hypothetical protein
MRIHIIIGTGYRPVVTTRRKNRDISTSTSITARINHSHDFVTTVINRSSSLAYPSQVIKQPSSVLNVRFEPIYRIMLHYSNWTRDDTKHIAEKVKFGVPILTMLECEKVVKSAFANGISMVCVITEDKAVLYCEALLRVGLKATVEEA